MQCTVYAQLIIVLHVFDYGSFVLHVFDYGSFVLRVFDYGSCVVVPPVLVTGKLPPVVASVNDWSVFLLCFIGCFRCCIVELCSVLTFDFFSYCR